MSRRWTKNWIEGGEEEEEEEEEEEGEEDEEGEDVKESRRVASRMATRGTMAELSFVFFSEMWIDQLGSGEKQNAR